MLPILKGSSAIICTICSSVNLSIEYESQWYDCKCFWTTSSA
ncbi:MAG: hypothetical protein EAZ91_06940 [Cytophagales bacterium]|nr:MAG: hypothetical protein EAZ91_06940 [Cytophagales bacterium]